MTQRNREFLCSLLKKMRNEAGLRQTELAEKLGKPQSYVSKYESGYKSLDIFEAKEICDAIGVSFSDFARNIEEL
jgi:transcriptional regulator with XRE-family HTH domain